MTLLVALLVALSLPMAYAADTRRLSAAFTGLVLVVAGYTAAQALPALV